MAKELLKHFHSLTLLSENAEKLKGLILELAIKGKLTREWRKKNPNVEPANELLKKIQEEKQKQLGKNIIKADKPLPKISEDEIPFVLPNIWKWERLGNLCEYIQRGKSPSYVDISSTPVISQKCVQWSGFDISRARYIDSVSIGTYAEERFLKVDDLLWNSTGDGTIGRVCLFPKLSYEKVVADSHVTIVRSFKNFILPRYLFIYTSSPSLQESLLVVANMCGNGFFSTPAMQLCSNSSSLEDLTVPEARICSIVFIKNPPVPQAGSSTFSPSFGSTISTINCVAALGV